eukprot:6404848-Pyramimonas_sp.AAC.1
MADDDPACVGDLAALLSSTRQALRAAIALSGRRARLAFWSRRIAAGASAPRTPLRSGQRSPKP